MGRPNTRSDNRPEFIASWMENYLRAQEIKTLYIKPRERSGEWHIELLEDKLGDEHFRDESVARLAIPGFSLTAVIGRRKQEIKSYSGTCAISLPSAARCMIFSSVASARFNSPETRP
jgi:hypothetical protein